METLMNQTDFAQLKLKNRLISMDEYTNGRVELESLPRVVFVELTQGCNLRCPMCRPNFLSHHSRRMTEEMFIKVANRLFPTAELVDLRGWGESLILPGIVDRIAFSQSFGVKLRIVSNFSFRRDLVLDALVRANAKIDISLDTSDAGTLEKVRTGSRLDLISRNIRYVVDSFGHSKNLRILATVQKLTIDELPKLIEYVADLGVQTVSLSSVTAESGSPLSIQSDTDKIDKVLEYAKEVARDCGVDLIAMTRLGSLPANPEGIAPCIHPWEYCYIAHNGDVGFCDHLIGPSAEEYYVGNITESDFDSIWNGKRMVRNRREHLDARRANAPQFSHCSWCYSNKYVDFENQMHESLEHQVVRLN